MSVPVDDAEKARQQLTQAYGSSEAAKAYATLALADSIRFAALTLSSAMLEAARIRAGKR